MAEIIPQITYDAPELVFHITGGDPVMRGLDHLDKMTFVSVTEQPTGTVVKADIEMFSKPGVYTGGQEQKLMVWLNGIANMLPLLPQHDEAISIGNISEYGPVAHIYPSLQHWINQDGLHPAIMNTAMRNMAAVMGERFKLQTPESHITVTGHLWPAEFDLTRWRDHGEQSAEGHATVRWNTPFLQTLGNCACLGSDASKRDLFVDNRPELYAIEPHNVDSLRQTLSLLVGLGTIATNMPKEFEPDDFWGGIEWQEHDVPRF